MKNIVIVIISSIFIFTGCSDYSRIEAINSELKSTVAELENDNFKLEEEVQLQLTEISNLKSKIHEYEEQVLSYQNEIDKITQKTNVLEWDKNEINYIVNHENPFSDEDINILDTVCELTLVDKKTRKFGDMESVSLLDFRGLIIASGTFKHLGDGETEFFSNKIAFYPDEKSLASFPKVKGDSRVLWFVLNDYNDIKDYFGDTDDSGRATIIINNYHIDLRTIETANSADLVHVIDVEVLDK